MTHPVLLPRLMKAPDAAAYLGMGTTKLLSLGLPVRVCGGLRLFDRHDLDDYASSLPIQGEERCDDADAVWGKRA